MDEERKEDAPQAPETSPEIPPVTAEVEAPTPPPPPEEAAPPRPAPPPARPEAPGGQRPAPPRPEAVRGPRPELTELRESLYRESGGYRLRLDPPDLARLRELPGSKDKTERELGEQFFDAQAARLVESIAGDVPTPAEVRVVVDPYSRQAFLAVGKTIRGILSF